MTTSNIVRALNDAKIGDACVEVRKLRHGSNGFDRWCYVHHHWLNDAPPQKTIGDVLAEEARRG